jgi:hypothetical protein
MRSMTNRQWIARVEENLRTIRHSTDPQRKPWTACMEMAVRDAKINQRHLKKENKSL